MILTSHSPGAGVSASFGLRHLLSCTTSVNLIPVSGLTVGWHRNEQALAMAGGLSIRLPQIGTEEQREMIALARHLA